MGVLRTPDERFRDLPDFAFETHYLEIDGGEGARLRLAYIDEGQDRSCCSCTASPPGPSFIARSLPRSGRASGSSRPT
jgi:haloalkane dehalogenase